jgi:RHS repeat-associated protein
LKFVDADSNHYKFTGKERDTESGLDYFGARYYSNRLGRFITPDWAAKAAAVPYAEFADPQSLNLYTYVRNTPTTKIDTDGHSPEWWQKLSNLVSYGHAVTDANLEKALDKDAKTYEKEMLERGATYNGSLLTEEDFAAKSNKEIADMGKDFNAALRNGNVGQGDVQLPLFPDPGQIGNGHAWAKHKGEFQGWTQKNFEDTITKKNPI